MVAPMVFLILRNMVTAAYSILGVCSVYSKVVAVIIDAATAATSAVRVIVFDSR